MKRFHVHISVDDLDANVRFYSIVFGAPPISQLGLKPGVDHLGVQVESEAELAALREQVAAAEIAALDQKNIVCCYARSDKYWITDPQGVAWETFHTLDSVPVYGETHRAGSTACCSPAQTANSQSGACC
jgi:hypothetical protein